ncbi:MAG: hypothetical protein LW708_22820 [Anabaena sp. 49628_E55]|nr:hypothetical protein [Anabaena sp. 49628_E55]
MITLKNGRMFGICGSYFKDADGCWGRMKSLDKLSKMVKLGCGIYFVMMFYSLLIDLKT